MRTEFANGGPDTGSRFLNVADTQERIARAEYRWKWGKGDWQISAEGAFNSLDNVTEFSSSGPTAAWSRSSFPAAAGRSRRTATR